MTAIELPALRPLSLSQLLDRAIRLYRQNFLVFIGIVAIGLVPVTLIQYALYVLTFEETQRGLEGMQDAATLPELLSAEGQAVGGFNLVIVMLLMFVLVSCIATGALSKGIEDSYLGRPISITGAYGRTGGRFFTLLAAMFIAVVLIVMLSFWMLFIPCIGWVTGPGLLIFFSYVIFPMVPAIVVIENHGPFRAIYRAWELARRRFWWVLGFVIVLSVLSWLTRVGPALLVNGLSGMVVQGLMPQADAQAQFAVESAITQAVTFLFQLVYLPIHTTAIILMYFDLRVRTEGFDLAVLAASADDPNAIAEKTPDAPPLDQQSPVTLNEAGYFAAISVGLLMVCVIFYVLLIVIAMASIGALQGM